MIPKVRLVAARLWWRLADACTVVGDYLTGLHPIASWEREMFKMTATEWDDVESRIRRVGE